MDQLALKEKIIIMKEKSANYDKLLFNFKIMEEKYNNLLKKYNTLQHKMENNTVAGELAIMTHNNYLLKKELDEIQYLYDVKNNLLNNNLPDKNMNIFTSLHTSNNQYTEEINKLKTNYNNRINIFESVIEKHKKRNNILLDNLEKHLDMIRELKLQNEIYKNEIENKANYISSLIGQIDDFKGNLGDQKNHIKDLNIDINNLELDIEKKEIIMGELNNDKKDLVKQNNNLIEDKCNLIETIAHRNGFIFILQEKNEKVLEEKNELLKNNKKLKEETEELQSYNIEFMERLMQKETLISRLEKENKKITDENDYKNNLMIENNELYININSLNNKIQKISEFNEIYLNELEETKKLTEIQKKEIETIEPLKLEIQRLNNEIKKLNNEIQQNNILSSINPLDWENVNININTNINDNINDFNDLDFTENDIDNNIDFINSIIAEDDNFDNILSKNTNLFDEKQTNDWTFVSKNAF